MDKAGYTKKCNGPKLINRRTGHYNDITSPDSKGYSSAAYEKIGRAHV